MQPLPSPPWYRRWSAILVGVIVLAAFAALIGWRGLQDAGTPTTTTGPLATVPPEPPTTRPEAQPSLTTARPPGVLWLAEGSDTHRSEVFRAPRNWRIEWSFDCSDFADGRGGNFKITGEGAFRDVLIQEFDTRESGTERMTRGGFGRLDITSVCEHWEVQAVRE